MVVNYKMGAEIEPMDMLQNAEFQCGFSDYKNGIPFKEYADINKSWSYERGRLFAASNPTLKSSAVSHQSQFLLNKAIHLSEII